jgi:hypothetical protein
MKVWRRPRTRTYIGRNDANNCAPQAKCDTIKRFIVEQITSREGKLSLSYTCTEMPQVIHEVGLNGLTCKCAEIIEISILTRFT